MKRLVAKLGVNYLWGLLNFTAGAIACGIWVAIALVAAGTVR